MASNAENVSIWWRHPVYGGDILKLSTITLLRLHIYGPALQVYLSSRSGAWIQPRLEAAGMPWDMFLYQRWLNFKINWRSAKKSNDILERHLSERLDHQAYGLQACHRCVSYRFIWCKWYGDCSASLYNDVIMNAMASQTTSLTIVYSTVYSGADQSKHQSSASMAFVWGIHRGPVNSPHKWPVTWKMLPFDDVIVV